MARIGRNVTMNITFETFNRGFTAWLPTRPAITEPAPQPYKLSAGNSKPVNMDIYGEGADLLSIQANLEERNVIFTPNGAAINPEPVPEVTPPPTQDEIDAAAFYDQAFNEEFDSMKAAIQSAIEIRYNVLNTTSIAFADVQTSEIKHLRQRA